MKINSRVRHILKAISWRLLGSIDTIILTFLLTGSLISGISVSVVEIVTKTFLYYLHERLWFKYKYFKNIPSKARHILKTITWRFIGSFDTIIIGWVILENVKLGLYIGGLELVTKMFLYYMHERLWYKFKIGLE